MPFGNGPKRFSRKPRACLQSLLKCSLSSFPVHFSLGNKLAADLAAMDGLSSRSVNAAAFNLS